MVNLHTEIQIAHRMSNVTKHSDTDNWHEIDDSLNDDWQLVRKT
jgi:hypothetical protein